MLKLLWRTLMEIMRFRRFYLISKLQIMSLFLKQWSTNAGKSLAINTAAESSRNALMVPMKIKGIN
jgi:hypothetical protein